MNEQEFLEALEKRENRRQQHGLGRPVIGVSLDEAIAQVKMPEKARVMLRRD